MKWVWPTSFGVMTLAFLTATIMAVNKPSKPISLVGADNFLIVTLDCGDGTFSQVYVDTVDFAKEGNPFWRGSRILQGDFNYDGTRSATDIIGLVNVVFKGYNVEYTPETTHVAIYYDESNGRKRVRFIEKLPAQP